MFDDDLWFAAELATWPTSHLKDFRLRSAGALKELGQRWKGVGDHAPAQVPEAVAKVTAKRDIGFVALLLILLSWPDFSYASGLVTGLPAVGSAPPYGVFPAQGGQWLTFDEVVCDCAMHNSRIEATLRPARRTPFVWSRA